MLIVKNKEALNEALSLYRENSKTIGFVPTMGALHKGHLSLLQKANEENDVSVCSIFVNPTQFNDKTDFANYPRTIDKDAELLENKECSILYLPTVEDIYDNEQPFSLDLKNLDKTLEGNYRAGHFEGVTRVVKRFFEIVRPNKSYFGLKDFQQYLIIKQLSETFHLGGEIIGCETLREPSGLAMSSRNQLLETEEISIAEEIYKSFISIKNKIEKYPLEVLITEEKVRLSKWFKIDYFEAKDERDLSTINENNFPFARLFFAGKIGKVRLIDNIRIFN